MKHPSPHNIKKSPSSIGSPSSVTTLSDTGDAAVLLQNHQTRHASPLSKVASIRRTSFMMRFEHEYQDEHDTDLREYLDEQEPIEMQRRFGSPLSISPVSRGANDEIQRHSVMFHPESMRAEYTDEIERNEERVRAMRKVGSGRIGAGKYTESGSPSRKRRQRGAQLSVDLNAIPPLPTPTLYSDHEVQMSTVAPLQLPVPEKHMQHRQSGAPSNSMRRFSMQDLQQATTELQSRYNIPLNVAFLAQKLQEGTWKKEQHIKRTSSNTALKRRHSDFVVHPHKSTGAKKLSTKASQRKPKRHSMVVLDAQTMGRTGNSPTKRASPLKQRMQNLKEVKRKKGKA